MTNNERAMYTGLAMCRNTEVAQRWARSQLFLIIHSAAFSFVAARAQPERRFLLVMGAVGVVLGVFWLLANWRTDQWIVYWQSCLVNFERTEHEPVETPIFSGLAYDRVAGFPFTFNRIVMALASFFLLAWIVVILIAFFV